MENKLVSTIIMATVGIILVGSLITAAVSASNESFYTTTTYSNAVVDDQITLSPITTESSKTLNVNSTNIVTDTGNIEYWDDAEYRNVILISENISVAATGDKTIYYALSDGWHTATSFTAAISAGTITYSVNEGDAVTISYSSGYVADPEGEFISCAADQTKYYSSVTFAQMLYTANYYTFIDGDGFKDGTEIAMNVTSEDVENTDGNVKTLTSITVYNQPLNSPCVMQKSIEYTHADNPGAVSLLGVIAPVMILAILVGVVGMIYLRRD